MLCPCGATLSLNPKNGQHSSEKILFSASSAEEPEWLPQTIHIRSLDEKEIVKQKKIVCIFFFFEFLDEAMSFMLLLPTGKSSLSRCVFWMFPAVCVIEGIINSWLIG